MRCYYSLYVSLQSSLVHLLFLCRDWHLRSLSGRSALVMHSYTSKVRLPTFVRPFRSQSRMRAMLRVSFSSIDYQLVAYHFLVFHSMARRSLYSTSLMLSASTAKRSSRRVVARDIQGVIQSSVLPAAAIVSSTAEYSHSFVPFVNSRCLLAVNTQVFPAHMFSRSSMGQHRKPGRRHLCFVPFPTTVPLLMVVPDLN